MKNVEHSHSDASQGCVLVVDDHPQLRQMLSLALETADFDVLESASVSTAERWLRQPRLHALVLDLQRAETHGLHVLRNLRARGDLSELPIVFLAGRDTDDLRWKALEAGADWFMLRPLSVIELQTRVSDLVRSGRPRLRAVASQRRLPRSLAG